ncbi:uncharacterized protein LOC108672452 [Hyalella azteca]|uniref:Uncharacterized protein LOC108672452 n=1 Tax=Hyalella azteca TaxID=294128 RepID=A0A8B7NPK3_HYAAZ|nr:uncharacterized protein LOC108672452 [Hyalella azteca]
MDYGCISAATQMWRNDYQESSGSVSRRNIPSFSSCNFSNFDKEEPVHITELQLRGQLRAYDLEIKRLKRQNPFHLVLEDLDFLQKITELRCAAKNLLWITGPSGLECSLQRVGRSVGVELGAPPDDGPTRLHNGILQAAFMEGTAIKQRMLDGATNQVPRKIITKYLDACQEMELLENLHLLEDLVSCLDAALEKHPSLPACERSGWSRPTYVQLLKKAYAWKRKYVECCDNVSTAAASCCSVYQGYATNLNNLLSTTLYNHEQHSPAASDEDATAEKSLEGLAALKQELQKQSVKNRAVNLRTALQVEAEHAKEMHWVVEALTACRQELEDRLHKVVLVRQLVDFIELRFAAQNNGFAEPPQDDRACGKDLTLLDYVLRSRFDVPDNVKAAVVSDVLRELRDFHDNNMAYQLLSPVNIIVNDAFNLRPLREATTTEPLPPWRFFAPELRQRHDSHLPSASKLCRKTQLVANLAFPASSVPPNKDLTALKKNAIGSSTAVNSSSYHEREVSSSNLKSLNEENEKIVLGRGEAEKASEAISTNLACDVYSLGQIILWLMCLGESMDTLEENMNSSLATHAVLRRMLTKDAIARPSINELLEYDWFGSPSTCPEKCHDPLVVFEEKCEELPLKMTSCDDYHFSPNSAFACVDKAPWSQEFQEGCSVLNPDEDVEVTRLRIYLEEEAIMKEMESNSDSEHDAPEHCFNDPLNNCTEIATIKNHVESSGDTCNPDSAELQVSPDDCNSDSASILDDITTGQFPVIFNGNVQPGNRIIVDTAASINDPFAPQTQRSDTFENESWTSTSDSCVSDTPSEAAKKYRHSKRAQGNSSLNAFNYASKFLPNHHVDDDVEKASGIVFSRPSGKPFQTLPYIANGSPSRDILSLLSTYENSTKDSKGSTSGPVTSPCSKEQITRNEINLDCQPKLVGEKTDGDSEDSSTLHECLRNSPQIKSKANSYPVKTNTQKTKPILRGRILNLRDERGSNQVEASSLNCYQSANVRAPAGNLYDRWQDKSGLIVPKSENYKPSLCGEDEELHEGPDEILLILEEGDKP